MNDNTSALPAPDHANIDLTTGVVAAYVSNNRVQPGDLPALIETIHAALSGLGVPVAPTVEKFTPAQIRKSITHEALISFIDGKSYKTLKRHLSTHGLTVETYRTRYGLPRDYPSTAASYSEARSAMAKALGLGQSRKKPVPMAAASAETIAEPPKARSRKKAAPAKPTKSRKAKTAKAAAAE